MNSNSDPSYNRPRYESEQVPFRCVSDTNRSADEWSSSTCGIWHESEFPSGDDIVGCQVADYHNAEAFCAMQGGRLPTMYEFAQNCVWGDGCNYNHELLWTSDKGNAKKEIAHSF